MKIVNICGQPRDIAHQDYAGWVQPGDTVEVPDHVGESLVLQTDVWSAYVPPKTTKIKEG